MGDVIRRFSGVALTLGGALVASAGPLVLPNHKLLLLID
jgi:hypothetical protein